MIDIQNLRKLNNLEKIAVTSHVQQRIMERGITISDVIKVIENGEIIKQYEDDYPLPSCLILGMSIKGRYLHIVVSNDSDYIYLITAYYPSLEQWEADFKTRRR